MAARNGRIAVSKSEKGGLDDVAEHAFGDASVPYGTTVAMLIDHYFNHNDN